MSWDTIEELQRDPRFAEAYGLLRQGDRLAVDHALAKASKRMQRLLGRHPQLPWEGLGPEDAAALDLAVRTQIALGVFRATFATQFSEGRTPITEAIDRAAETVDADAARLVFTRLRQEKDGLGTFDVAKASAFHQLIADLTDVYGMPALRLASIASGAALSVDVVLENVEDEDEADDQLADIRRGGARSIHAHARRKDIPLVHGAALWVLAMRGRGNVFGEEERTVTYTDHG